MLGSRLGSLEAQRYSNARWDAAPHGTQSSMRLTHIFGFPSPSAGWSEAARSGHCRRRVDIRLSLATFALSARKLQARLASSRMARRRYSVRRHFKRLECRPSVISFSHASFNPKKVDPTESALDVNREATSGLPPVFADLAVALCRRMNNPTRSCTGCHGDVGVTKDPSLNGFRAWFGASLDWPRRCLCQALDWFRRSGLVPALRRGGLIVSRQPIDGSLPSTIALPYSPYSRIRLNVHRSNASMLIGSPEKNQLQRSG